MRRYSVGDHVHRPLGMRRVERRVPRFLHHNLGGLGSGQELLVDGVEFYKVAEVFWLCVGRALRLALVGKDQAPCPDQNTNRNYNTDRSCNATLREYCYEGKDD